MIKDILKYRVQYITDFDGNRSYSQQVKEVCEGGIRWIQLRMKTANKDELLSEAYQIKNICDSYQAIFIVNDNVEVAKEVDADGVHLGKNDTCPLDAREILGSDKIIGATCNTFEDIKDNEKKGVDYFGVGPFRFTQTKKGLSDILGFEGYKEILRFMNVDQINTPIFAIGGIKLEDISPLLKMGVHGIALSSYLKNSESIKSKSEDIIKEINISI